jgi:hypothetical protein
MVALLRAEPCGGQPPNAAPDGITVVGRASMWSHDVDYKAAARSSVMSPRESLERPPSGLGYTLLVHL